MVLASGYYLEANRPYFPAALVPAEALERMRPVAGVLPPVANVAIECRLQAGAGNVDFIPQFVQRGGSGRKLAGYRPDDAIWGRVGRFCEAWGGEKGRGTQGNSGELGGTQEEEGARLGEVFHAIWLEFDMGAVEGEVPKPSIFVGFAGVGDLAYYQGLAETSVGLLQGELLTAGFRGNLAACFAHLPAPANLFSIGLMLARQYDRARVCIGRLPPAHLRSYLEGIGWPGSLHEVEQLAAVLSPLVDEYGLALDVGERITGKLGIECYLYENNPQKEPRWGQLLDYLVEVGQCAPEKKEALLGWPGRQLHGLTPVEAAELRSVAHSLPPRNQNLLTRRISHLKVVLEPGRPMETKGYLELSHVWYPFGQSGKLTSAGEHED
jgi:hypothetical protein